MTRRLVCSICKNPIEMNESGWDQGHNAQPVNDGRCCDVCNDTVVIPTRIARLTGGTKPPDARSE